MERQGAPVVAEALPLPEHFLQGRRGKLVETGEPFNETDVLRNDPVDLGLLKHYLRDVNPVGPGTVPPGKVAAMTLIVGIYLFPEVRGSPPGSIDIQGLYGRSLIMVRM